MPPALDIQNIIAQNPLIADMAKAKPVYWLNPNLGSSANGIALSGFSESDARNAEERLKRFAPFLAKAFPETAANNGIIESPMQRVPGYRTALQDYWQVQIPGEVIVKLDSHLPVSGSIKARGGFYEVLAHAEQLAHAHNLITLESDYTFFATEKSKAFFNGYSLAVGSTGNLGLSVGIMAAALGFKTTVHMSADARQWKKDKLRAHGVTVIEYAADYEVAVAEGRKAAEADPACHFVDDEHSRNLFLGYSVAGLRLKNQLEKMDIEVSATSPLIVYLPCGVGGGPGGVAFGLKLMFGDNVHCFFAEPTEAPAVSLGMISGLNSKISGADLGLSGSTAADGLAVSRPSELVCKAMHQLLSGAFTVQDDTLFKLLHLLAKSENIQLEPSALAGVSGLKLAAKGLLGPVPALKNATHIFWATGGSLVPANEWQQYNQKGLELLEKE